MPGNFPNTCFRIPHVNTAFEVTGASVSGIRAALDAKGVKDVNVIGWAGDGGTADIGIQALSGMVERGTRAIYIMYDNEAYMNTGIQRSGSTPWGAWTTTTPIGNSHGFKHEFKKDIMAIMQAHKIPYAATVSPAFPEDFIKKVEKAKKIKGFRFIHALSPCPPGWRTTPQLSVEIARLAVDARVFPLYEVEDGKVHITRKGRGLPVVDYLKVQGRFQHLTEEEITAIQKIVDDNWIMLLLKESSGT
jgi:2-oxoisovalerate ferredoxin oxidoreductase beta subunit